MKPEQLATSMQSPPTGVSELLITPFLILQVTLTAQIYYRQPVADTEHMLMRFSTDDNEGFWAKGQSADFVFKDFRGTLVLQVSVSSKGLRPSALGVSYEPNCLIWLDLQPIPEDIIGGLPGEVAAEIRLNQAGKFAGAPHGNA